MSRVCDSILFCIRQHQASGTVISFWYVFSDYKGGDDISWLVTVRATSSSVNERMSQLSILMTFRRIRHHHLLYGVSFLTTKQCQQGSQCLCQCCSSFYAEDDGSGRRHRGAVLEGDVVQVIIHLPSQSMTAGNIFFLRGGQCPEDVCRKFAFLRLHGIVHHWGDLRDPSVIEEVRPSTS